MRRTLSTILALALVIANAPTVAFAETAAAPTSTPAAPITPVSPAPLHARTVVALVSAGIAVAAAGTATIFGGLALQNKSDFQSSATYAHADDGNDDAAYADGAIALAIAAGVTSLVLFLTHDPDDRASQRVTVSASPFVTAHGGGAGALLRF